MFRAKANFLLGILFILPFFSYTQNWKILLQAKGPSTVLSRGVEMGLNGEIYWIGIFEQYVVLGPDTLYSAGSSDGFICKYEASGQQKWCHRFGGINLDRVMSTAVDKAGNVYFTGGFSDEVIFGNDTLFSQNRDIFVVKYNSSGHVVWAKAIEGNLSDFGQGIAVDAQQQVFLTGVFMSDSLKMGSTSLYKQGNSDMFLIKLDINGQPVWAQQGGGVSTTLGNAVALDSLNHIYVTGSFQDSASFSGHWLHSQGRSDAFVACYEASGSLNWARPISGPGFDAGDALAGTEDGVIVTGRFSDLLSIDTFTLAHQGNYDIFMAAYAANGDALWAKGIGGISKDGSYGLDYQKDYGLYMVGEYSDQVVFDQDSLKSKGSTDAFLAKYDPQGHLRWVLSAGGVDKEQAFASFATRNQEIFFAGHFRDMAMFDSIILSSGGRDDAFMAKIYDQDTLPLPPPVNILPLMGKVFEDSNQDCRADSLEMGYARWFVLAEPGGYFALSDQQGDFSLDLPPQAYRLRSLMPQDLRSWLYSNCPPIQYAAIGGGPTQNPRPLAFGQVEKAEVQLQLSVDAEDFVRCQNSQMLLHYANLGAETAKDISIALYLPEKISILHAGVSYSSQGSGKYIFRPGDLLPQQEGTIPIQTTVSCASHDIVGENLSIQAEIHTASMRQASDPRWNGAELHAYGSCLGGDSALFVIKNAGTAPLKDSVSIRFFADDLYCREAKIWLAAGDSLGYQISSHGQTIRLEVQQAAFHPREQWLSTYIEACLEDQGLPLSLGFVRHFPQYDPLPSHIFERNMPLLKAAQPLKWEIQPTGRGPQHAIGADERLYFHLGYRPSSVLYQLTFSDTLSSLLDPASMRWEARSHAFELSVDGIGSPALHFSLSHDSVEAGEQAYVSFSMKLKTGVPEGSSMRQRAWVKADTAAWQPTDWLYHSLGGGPTDPACGMRIKPYVFVKPIQTALSPQNAGWACSIQPNPFHSQLGFHFNQLPYNLEIQFFDLSGKKIKTYKPKPVPLLNIDLAALSPGIYFVHVLTEKGTQIQKIIKR